MDNTKTYPKFHQDFTYAEKLFEIAEKNVQYDGYTLKLISWDESVKVDFQYFRGFKGWPGYWFRVKFPEDEQYLDKNTRPAPDYEVINYLSQFRLVGDNGFNE